MRREKVSLVDKNDDVIGSKWRDELTDDDCWRVISIWVEDQNGNILLQQRSINKQIGPGIWSAAAEGTVEEGHSQIDTAIRELEEEVGLKVTTSDLIETTKIYYKDPQFGWRIKQGYKLMISHIPENEIEVQESEVAQVKWFSTEEFHDFVAKNPKKFVLDTEYRKLKFY